MGIIKKGAAKKKAATKKKKNMTEAEKTRRHIIDLVNVGNDVEAANVLHDYIRSQAGLENKLHEAAKDLTEPEQKKEGRIAKIAKKIFSSNTRTL